MTIRHMLVVIAALLSNCSDPADQEVNGSNPETQVAPNHDITGAEKDPDVIVNDDLRLSFIDGKWRSRSPEDEISLSFDYKVLTIMSNARWRDLNGVKVLVSEEELNFICNGDLFLISCFNRDSKSPILTVFRESPMESDNYEKIEFVRGEDCE